MAKYQNQTEVVDAEVIAKEIILLTEDGRSYVGRPGEWLITHADGRKTTCDADTFPILYVPVPDNRRFVAGPGKWLDIQPKKKKRGRPTTYTKRVGEKLCLLLEQGKSLREICAMDGMPSTSVFYQWYKRNPEFAERYADARALQAILMDDDLQAVADDSSRDYRTEERDGRNVEVVDHEHIQRSKLRVDTMKFRMSKMAPRLYGEKVNHEVTVKDGGALEIRWASPEELSPEDQEAAGCGG